MNRIKILRLVNNKTQKDIADYLGVTRKAISLYEKGDREPNQKNVASISRLLQCFSALFKG